MTSKKRLLWQLYPSYLLITLLALVIVSLFTLNSLSNFFYEEKNKDLVSRAHLIKVKISELVHSGDFKSVDAECKRSGYDSGTRITVILPSGVVIGDSENDPKTMDTHNDRPEIAQALSGKTGASIRKSSTLNFNMMYVAIPVLKENEVLAVVRTSVSVSSIDSQMRKTRLTIGAVGVFAALLAAVVSLMVARRITRPIEDMTRGAEQFETGNLKHRLYVPESFELGALAQAMNRMADQLDERIKTETRQKNELIAVLSGMVEGVIALDSQDNIISINSAAAGFFKVDTPWSTGKNISDLVRNLTFLDFFNKARNSIDNLEADIPLNDQGKRTIHIRTAPLLDEKSSRSGTLIVFSDVTTLRRLETMRRDFAANVSHEIKTPLTSIRGFVETLLNDREQLSDNQRHFLEIIDKNVNRLMAIIDDLLQLARIEKEGSELRWDNARVKPVLENAIQTIKAEAQKKNIRITLDCDDQLSVRMDSSMIEQAVVNLIDNAVKYTENNGDVTVSANRDSKVKICVADTGYGIENEHLPRLFERFYRTDKARSRQQGGTGLGLAIVKHIMLAHKGDVTVESTPGKGSVFTLHLPVSP
jgi:two-component system phosphate regulon sensor histidine kinase PhoR